MKSIKGPTQIVLSSGDMVTLFEDQCRLCLMKCSVEDSNISNVLEKYERLTGFTVYDLDIPRKICLDCLARIEELADFYDQCSRTEGLLQEIRHAPEIQVKKEESDDDVYVQEEHEEEREVEVQLDNNLVEDVVKYYKIEEVLPKVQPKERVKRNVRKVIENTADFDCLREILGTVPQDCELFVLSFENPPVQELSDNQDFTQSADLFTCSYCDHHGTRLNGLKWHFLQMHPEAKWFQCPWCQWTCYNLDRMRVHTSTTKNHHQIMAPFTQLRCDCCTYQTWQQAAMELHCGTFHQSFQVVCDCGSTFPCKDLKLQHLLLRCQCSPKTCRLPYEKFLNGSEPQEDRHAKVVCEICGKAVAKKHIKYHKEIHHAKEYGLETVRFYCDLCNNSYKAKRELKLHMLKVHLKIASYKCTHCDRTFRNWNSRKYHVLTVHEYDLIQYSCDHCGKKFANKFKMSEHRTMHSNIRKFQCTLCEKTYKNLSMLREHRSTVHATTRPHFCTICSKTFKDRKGLKQHTRTHTERQFKCPIQVCQQTFTVSHTLRNHMSNRHPEFPMPPVGTSLRNVDLNIFLQGTEEHLTIEYLN